MNAKTYFLAAIALNTALLTFACLCQSSQGQYGLNGLGGTALTGPSGKFGPVIEFVLPAANTKGAAELLDLETSRTLAQPSFDSSDSPANAIMDWIRTNGFDISCSVWPTLAACVTYDMTVVAVEE